MEKQERHGKSEVGLTIIGIGKLIKVAVLVTAGITALVAAKHDPPQMLADLANVLHVDPNGHVLHRAVAKLAGAQPKQLEEVGFASFFYAALFAVEGVGLLMRKKWAEYLTIVITLSFIPLEVYELTKHFSAPRVVTLVLNAAVVVYLVVRVVSDRGRRPAHGQLGIASH